MTPHQRFLEQILELIAHRNFQISEHGYDEMVEDNIAVIDLTVNSSEAVIVEYYPEYHKGPCVLLLMKDHVGNPLHVLWGIPAGKVSPAVVITAYRPEPERWSEDLMRRKK